MYGCDFKKFLKSEESKLFRESELFGQQFFSRLRVRDAFATNRQDLYKLSWSEEKFPEEKFHIWDMNSWYSYCLSAFDFPTGSYEIYLNQEIKKFIRQNMDTKEIYHVDNRKLGGIVKAVLLPGDDPSPYLTHDFGNKDLSNKMAVLCRTCGLKANKKHCQHGKKTITLR